MLLEDLKNARDLITSPERWTKTAFARDKNNEITSPSNPYAEKWCMLGAMFKVTKSNERYKAIKDILLFTIYGCRVCAEPIVIKWNDAPERQHQEVLALLDSIIINLTPKVEVKVKPECLVLEDA